MTFRTKRHILCGTAALALTAGAVQAQDMPFPVGEGGFHWDGYNSFAESHDLSGETIEITGPWTGYEKDKVDIMFRYFEEATGAEVNYSGSDSFEQDIVISARAGTAPNLAVFPQPGLAADMAKQGYLTPLPDGTSDWIAENYAAGVSWVDLATYEGEDGEEHLYGQFYRVDLKSLVWYSPIAFDEMGYEIPESMEELKELTEQIVDDGGTPWCIGLGSGAATGWPATDWVEDLMLRTQEPQVYDQWVSNEIPFDDPAVVGAIDEFGWFVRNDDFVQGGAQSAATTDFRDSPSGLFSVPPECYMHRQASFIPAFFPEDAELGDNVDFFYFPAYEDKDLGKPVLGAGTLFSITNPSEATNVMLEWLKLPIAHELWMAQDGFLTAHAGVNLDVYATDAQRAMGEIISEATTFRYDASDLMPAEIGAGAFWTGMVDYVTGTPAEQVAETVQSRWDTLQ
ncbi:MAG: carbohydrate ABC transporter substrate-binding protein [Rhodobacteraceae bacterium]|jgi:alpha-glucoside transport system substrate-binding protein|uniref:Sucrose-binding protein n=1 Tax=Salipiger profundus TaxID=1229727 RepID=A0A1U7D9E1_9RHOB|nr:MULTISPECIES: ABC transporter substrate-binding protein [Salipiger]APX24797.1 sucrose-binding protein [Salipiger profundus]MAB07715.1 carbohydrate ABC transporter substrate-binding protein [Paracoccaceae bacterium]GFZ97885.1 alpha-glucoside ABC transporter substrate-binding protein [Salipiger profundus]SFC98943.1 maltose-binding protein /trehalose-binding protein /sucrose-binding protein [Salipiger profundus]